MTEPSTIGGRRVLIVEDEPRLRDMLVRAIRDMEFTVTAAPTAEVAIDLLAGEVVDIVLSDLNLPGMHGLEFCEHVRRTWPEIQLLILTGYGDLEVAKKAIRLDVVDFLTKPCPLGELEAGGLQRRPHTITRLADLGVRQADQGKGRQAIGEMGLDHHLGRGHAVQGPGMHQGEGHRDLHWGKHRV